MRTFVRSLKCHAVVSTLLLSFFVLIEYQAPSTAHAAPLSQLFSCAWVEAFFTVPEDVYALSVDMAGGSGGVDWSRGYGGRVETTIQVSPGEELEIRTGCAGIVPRQSWDMGVGGYPNGGWGAKRDHTMVSSGGGGSSSIHDLNGSPFVVAGGGGGATLQSRAAGSGGQNGTDAGDCQAVNPQLRGRGATQSAPGSPTQNLAGQVNTSPGGFMRGGDGWWAGGGGGGYYGGSGGSGDIEWTSDLQDYGCAGGGGSSYVDPVRNASFSAPVYVTGYEDSDGYISLSWTPTPTTTTTLALSTTTTSATTTSTTVPTTAPTTIPTTSRVVTITSTTRPLITSATIPTTSRVTTTTSSSTTTPATISNTSTAAKATPSWTSTPDVESELPVVGVTPFPISGSGTVEVTNETGFVVTKAGAFVPKWRTRVYIGDFKFSLKATYIENKKNKTFACTIATFGTQKLQKTSFSWRWYQPIQGCILPKVLVTQLAQRKTSMMLTGTFARKWATTGKSQRPDGSFITTRNIGLKIGASDTVTLS